MELRKGDTVKVLSGVDKGKTGEILDVIASENKVLVKGVNVRKKSVKRRWNYFCRSSYTSIKSKPSLPKMQSCNKNWSR